MLAAFYFCLLLISVLPLRACGFSIAVSIGMASPITIALLCVAGIICDTLSIRITASAIVTGVLVICITASAVTVFARRHALSSSAVSPGRAKPHGGIHHNLFDPTIDAGYFDMHYLLLYLFVAAVICGVFFVLPLDGPDSFVQYADNTAHLGRIKAMAVDGSFSILHTGVYPSSMSSVAQPLNIKAGFYPAALPLLASLSVNLFGVSAALAENVVLFVFMAFVLPSGSYLMHVALFKDNRGAVLFGAFSTMMFAAFPFGLLLYGPLYPNMASMCCAPHVAFAFISIWSKCRPVCQRLAFALLFFLSSVALASLQPNTVFLLIVFLTPFCCHALYQHFSSPKKKGEPIRSKRGLLAALLFAGFAVTVWVICFKLPAFQSVVTFRWEKLYTVGYGIWSLFSLGLRRDLPQYVAAVLVLVGVMAALFDARYRWMTFSYGIMGLIYVVGITSEGLLKQLLAGFWYTDPYRTAASVALLAMPIASLALATLVRAVWSKVPHCVQSHYAVEIAACLVVGFAAVVTNVLMPNYGYSQGAFTEVYLELSSLNVKNENKIVTAEEDAFLKEVAAVTGNDMVINNPFDGSVFAYSVYGINVYYKAFPSQKHESEDSITIRRGIDEYPENQRVKKAVEDIDARYILIMDTSNYLPFSDEELWSPFILYPYTKWEAFETIDPNGQEYEVVLDDGVNKLLKIIR